jgi:anthranilate synthase / indole-3-glycerol phosphate synthase
LTRPRPADFYARLKSEAGRLAVLAEIKRASPSKKWIAKDIVAAEQGLTYATAGAAAISVLCEPHWFKVSAPVSLTARRNTFRCIERVLTPCTRHTRCSPDLPG